MCVLNHELPGRVVVSSPKQSMFPLQEALKTPLLAVCGGQDLLLESVFLVLRNKEMVRAKVSRGLTGFQLSLLWVMYLKTTADSFATL